MARAAALRAAPAGLLSAHCTPAALGSLRLWQHHKAARSPRPSTLAVSLASPLGVRPFHATPSRRDEAAAKVEEEATAKVDEEAGSKAEEGATPKDKKRAESKNKKKKKKKKVENKDMPNGNDKSKPTEPAPKPTKPTPKPVEELPPYTNQHQTPAGLVEWNDRFLNIRARDDDGRAICYRTPIGLLWLRDACPCPLCVDPHSGQKNFATTDLPARPALEHAELAEDGSLKLVWAADTPTAAERHTSVFPATEVAQWATEPRWQRNRVRTSTGPSMVWDRAMYEGALAEGRCRVSYEDWLAGGPAYERALADLSQTGLIFVTDVPHGEAEVERVGEAIGPLQQTFYGRTWDVRSKPEAENVAYTSQFLGLHQDLMYHDPVPGLQLLHCLHNDCAGGESLFSHGPRAALELKIASLPRFNALSSIPASYAYNKNGNHYYRRHPVLQLNVRSREPLETRWAPPFQTTFTLRANVAPIQAELKLNQWRDAASAFQRILESETNTVEVKLKPGECVIFNNRVVLHGRRQFAPGGGGERWLKGAYITAQSFSAACQRVLQVPPPSKETRSQRTRREVQESLAARAAAETSGAEAAEAPTPADEASSPQQ